jgi:hypothetical protein
MLTERKPTAEMTLEDVRQRWPRVTAHLIAESLGYATPDGAAYIIRDGLLERRNWCEWIDACYQGDARRALREAIARRHDHRGYMAEYGRAMAIVRHVNSGGDGPQLASWF